MKTKPHLPSAICHLLCALALLLAPLTFTGCASRSLDPTGVYQGDQYLYETELAIVTSYDVIQTFLKWEKDNRALLRRWPALKRSADEMRRDAPNWFKTAHAAHDAYKLNPGAPTKSELELALSLLRTALAEATRYMTQTATPN